MLNPTESKQNNLKNWTSSQGVPSQAWHTWNHVIMSGDGASSLFGARIWSRVCEQLTSTPLHDPICGTDIYKIIYRSTDQRDSLVGHEGWLMPILFPAQDGEVESVTSDALKLASKARAEDCELSWLSKWILHISELINLANTPYIDLLLVRWIGIFWPITRHVKMVLTLFCLF